MLPTDEQIKFMHKQIEELPEDWPLSKKLICLATLSDEQIEDEIKKGKEVK